MSDQAATDLSALLESLSDLMSATATADPASPTPCAEWSLSELADHIAGNTVNFAVAAEGGQPDWSSPADIGPDAAAAFQSAAARLRAAIADGVSEQVVAMASAELATHTWDLTRALGRTTTDLPPGAAERGLSFMRSGFESSGRGEYFGPEQPAPDGADAYTKLAAYAGRDA
ncbi:MAG: TIGR03086 family metal-binding protein [Marmoricola sp.]